jgi:hypothetical protein
MYGGPRYFLFAVCAGVWLGEGGGLVIDEEERA